MAIATTSAEHMCSAGSSSGRHCAGAVAAVGHMPTGGMAQTCGRTIKGVRKSPSAAATAIAGDVIASVEHIFQLLIIICLFSNCVRTHGTNSIRFS